MEPGHEDREYGLAEWTLVPAIETPQWSPVMKTGNTVDAATGGLILEPPQWSPVMKTGNTRTRWPPGSGWTSLNGARS